MKQVRHTAALATALVLASAATYAQDGNAVAGHAFARRACKPCHAVEDEREPRMMVIGPGFRDIANTPGMTATAIGVFLRTSHPKMPDLILTPEETEDVIAYLVSLHDRP